MIQCLSELSKWKWIKNNFRPFSKKRLDKFSIWFSTPNWYPTTFAKILSGKINLSYTSVPLTHKDLSVIFYRNILFHSNITGSSDAPAVWFFGFRQKMCENSLTSVRTKILSFLSAYDVTRGPQMQTRHTVSLQYMHTISSRTWGDVVLWMKSWNHIYSWSISLLSSL